VQTKYLIISNVGLAIQLYVPLAFPPWTRDKWVVRGVQPETPPSDGRNVNSCEPVSENWKREFDMEEVSWVNDCLFKD